MTGPDTKTYPSELAGQAQQGWQNLLGSALEFAGSFVQPERLDERRSLEPERRYVDRDTGPRGYFWGIAAIAAGVLVLVLILKK